PAREPSDRQLLLGAVGEWVTRPAEQLGAVRSAVAEVATNAGQWVEVGRRFVDVARTVARGNAPSSPLNTTVSRNRRITVASG
ncbi:wax ester/triacylglycerol synthase domain-containing protein, partial [Mycolicibacterium elephantis]